jgi:peptide/nickel transport system permease protein
MLDLIVRRIAISIPILALVVTLAFVLVRALPGHPDALLDLDAAAEFTPEVLSSDPRRPVLEEFADWSTALFLRGDFGYSTLRRQPVSEVLADAIPHTLRLTIPALVLQVLVGVGLGIIAATRRGSVADGGVRIVSLILFSTPSFYLGIVLMFVFAGGVFSWLPTSGAESLGAGHSSLAERLLDQTRHLVLPVLTLVLGSSAVWARFTRAELLEVLGVEHIVAARARGVSERRIVWRHALRAAIVPLVTLLGLAFPYLIGGAVIVEMVYGWPGIGRLAVRAVIARDYDLFLAIQIVVGSTVLLGNLIADLAQAGIDPRIRRPA